MQRLQIFNTLTRTKENFEPINSPFVGMYVCGPTVYGDPHLGHARSALSFDLVFRYLTFLGYKVRYVRNITDVGHLTDDVAGTGEDKLQKKARLEQLEPMEIAQLYTLHYNRDMALLNTLSPSIEPRATGHIPEQIEAIEKILENGFAYVINGSVYFDVKKYNDSYPYGKLSGRNLEETLEGYRELDGQEEKRSKEDFALWKNASPEHLMKWNSPWGVGFPGWHIECTAMSTRYLGQKYDIHGGGLDLMFPHHEAEIAQSNALSHPCDVSHQDEAKYWLHNNMITVNGQKMGKSLNNFINLDEFFSGNHPALDKSYAPMTIRFFILQAHYRSTLDFSNEGLLAAEKGFARLTEARNKLNELKNSFSGNDLNTNSDLEKELDGFGVEAAECMNDDFNSAKLIALMFGKISAIHTLSRQPEMHFQVNRDIFVRFADLFLSYYSDVLGLLPDTGSGVALEKISALVDIVLEWRAEVKKNKDFATSDLIRNKLEEAGINIKDTREGTEWSLASQ
jgi:cysteinyl-tRNA synthetase